MGLSNKYILMLVRLLLIAALLAAGAASAAVANTQKGVRLIIPFPPGGGNDIVGRMVGNQLSERLGRPVVIDNRGGGGGVIGTELAANAQPDGNTLLIISATYAVNASLYKLSYDPVKAFAPVAMFGSSPNLLVVHPGLPVNSVRELIATAKAKPGQLNYASGGVGSNPHLSAALFSSFAGIKTLHVPFRGTGPMIVDVIGGQSHFCIGPLMALFPHVNTGRLKALGITALTRSALLPDVLTVAESGVPRYESSNWWGVVAPAGTPRAVLAKLHSEVSALLSSAETRKWFAAEGATSVNQSPEEFGKYIVSEIAKWGNVIREFGIRAE